MTDKVQKIKQEIERRIKEGSSKNDISEGALALDSLLDFIDSLPEESGCEVNFTTKNEDLEEEIDRYYSDWQFDDDTIYKDMRDICRHFAEWQKHQMMKDAVETTIVNDWQYGKDPDHAIIPAIHQRIEGFNIGDRVKIIIVKED